MQEFEAEKWCLKCFDYGSLYVKVLSCCKVSFSLRKIYNKTIISNLVINENNENYLVSRGLVQFSVAVDSKLKRDL